MQHPRTLTALAIAGAVVSVAGCSLGPGGPTPAYGPPVDVLVANSTYLLGDVIGGRRERARRAAAAKISGIAPHTAPQYMATQEAELRRLTAGTGIDVFRAGDAVVMRMPAAIAFDVGRSDVKPQFRTTLEEVARPLKTSSRTYVDVLGHTDTTGNPASNQTLSERRAKSVADYLVARGVARARISTRGYGETHPLYNPETSEMQRAANRRVEVKIVPIRQGDRR